MATTRYTVSKQLPTAGNNALAPNNYYICTYELGPELTMGPVGHGAVTPKSEYCQVFNAEDCAQNWTDRCQYIANDMTVVPNVANPIRLPYGNNKQTTVGDNLLVEVARKKYCQLVGDVQTVGLNVLGTQYSQTIPKNYANTQVCTCDPTAIDDDVVMNQILDREIGYDIIMNIYRTCGRNNIDISKTRLFKKARVLEQLGY